MSIFSRFTAKKPAASVASQDNAPATVMANGASVGARPLVNPAWGGGYTPERIALILENAERGDEHSLAEFFKLADRVIEREMHTAGVVNGLVLAVAGLPHKAEPPRGDASKRARKLADEVQAFLEPGTALRLAAPGLISQGITHSIGPAAIVYETTAEAYTPVDFIQKPAHFYTFDRRDGRTPLLRSGTAGQPAEPLEPGMHLVFTPHRMSALQVKNSLAWTLCWAYVIKSVTLANQASFIEAFGHPVVVGKHGRNASPQDVGMLRQAVMALQSGMRAVFRDDLEIEFKEIARPNTDIYEKLCRYLDELISKVVWASTLTTDAGGSGTYALGKVHAEGKYDVIRAYAGQWAACLQSQLVAPYIAWKYGPDAPVPRIVVDVEEAEDLVAKSQIVKNLTDAGVQLDAAEIRESFGFRNPEEGAETVGSRPATPAVPEGATAPQSRQAASGCPVHSLTAQAASEPARDALDDLADQMLADYAPLSLEIDRRLATAAQAATSAEDLRAAVQSVVESLDASALQELLAAARLKARLAGDLGGTV